MEPQGKETHYILQGKFSTKKIGKMKIYLKNYILAKPDILSEKCHKELNIIDCFKYEGAISPKRK